MLINGFFNALNSVLSWLISMRPDWTPSLDPTVGQLVGQALAWDWAFPVHECIADILLVIAGFTAVTGLKWAVKLCDWIADVIP